MKEVKKEIMLKEYSLKGITDRLLSIWREELNLLTIGVEDNFFTLNYLDPEKN